MSTNESEINKTETEVKPPEGTENNAEPQKPRYVYGDFSDIVVALIASLILYSGLIWFACSYNNGNDKPVLILAGIAGAALGWIVGILMSPYNHEQKMFSEVAKIGYGFLTGYVLSKVDPLINKLVGIDKTDLNTNFIIVVTYFFASLITSIALTYISRAYWTRERELKEGK